MRNPWLDIPLADYEGHMALPSIGQANLLAQLFAQLLAEYAPSSVAVVGCAGGNGFDCAALRTMRRVVAIDINPAYVEALHARYARTIPGLELHVADIQDEALCIEPVDLVYAALLFEYVDAQRAFANFKALAQPGATLVAVLQLPSPEIAAISPSPFTALQSLEPIMRLVSPRTLRSQARHAGFAMNSSETLRLPSGKAFEVMRFALRAD